MAGAGIRTLREPGPGTRTASPERNSRIGPAMAYEQQDPDSTRPRRKTRRLEELERAR